MKNTRVRAKRSAGRNELELDRRIRQYLDFLRLEKGVTSHTLHSYQFDLAKYRAFLLKHNITTPILITQEDVGDFLRDLARRSLSPRSAARILSAIRGFHRFPYYSPPHDVDCRSDPCLCLQLGYQCL